MDQPNNLNCPQFPDPQLGFWAISPRLQKASGQTHQKHLITVINLFFPILYISHDMSLKIRCSSCGRGTSGKHSLCSDCRGPSVEKIVYVAESGDRIEVTTFERQSKSSSSSSRPHRRRESRAGHTSSGRHAGPSHTAAYQGSSAEPYRDAGRYLGRDERDVEWDVANEYPFHYSTRHPQTGHEIPGVAYVRPRVQPYQNTYDYVAANIQYVYPPQQSGGHPVNPQMSGYHGPPPHGGYWQPLNGAYQPQADYAPGPQAPYAPEQQASGQSTRVNYVYSGTEGPDGEPID